MSLQIESPAFDDGDTIPRKYAAVGENISPPLKFSNLPPGTRELALIVDDPDAPHTNAFTHWVLYKIPSSMTEIPEAFESSAIVQGRNDAQTNAYFGPKPPPGHGPHHYHFRLYALDREIQRQPHHSKQSLLVAMSGHILDQADLTGVFEQSRD